MNEYIDNFLNRWVLPDLRTDHIAYHLARFGFISCVLGLFSGLTLVILCIYLDFTYGVIGSLTSLSGFLYFIISIRHSARVRIHAYVVLTVFVLGLQIGILGTGSIISGLSLSYIILIRIAYYFDSKIGFFWSASLLCFLLFWSIFEYHGLIKFNVQLVDRPLHLFDLYSFMFFIVVAILFLIVDKINNDKLILTLDQNRNALISHEKMQSLQRVTAGLAHELNNPVNFISNNVEALHMDIKDIDEILQILKEIKKDETVEYKTRLLDAVHKIDIDTISQELQLITSGIINGSNRIAEIIQKLQFFIEHDKTDKIQSKVGSLVDSAIEVSTIDSKKQIKIIKNYSECPLISVHPHQIIHAISNIILNALSAIEDEGKITITTESTKENHITISIIDDGKGMSKKEIQHIFDPFYTTKEVGEGLGLGLYISHGIIQAHQGEIEVLSTKGIGTEIIIRLPLTN